MGKCIFIYGFFFSSFQQFIKLYPTLFGKENEESVEDEGTNRGSETDNNFKLNWGWIENVDIISRETNRTWEQTFKLNVIEFLNTISYLIDRNNKNKINIKNGLL